MFTGITGEKEAALLAEERCGQCPYKAPTGIGKPSIGALNWGQPTQTLARSQEVAQLPTSVVSLRPKPVESQLVLINMQHRTSQRLLCCRF